MRATCEKYGKGRYYSTFSRRVREEVKGLALQVEDLANLVAVLIKYGLKISLKKCQLFHDKLIMGLEFLIKLQ